MLCLSLIRFRDIIHEFGRGSGALSTCAKELIDLLYRRWAIPLVVDLNEVLLTDRSQEYADVVADKCGGVLTHIIAFIDGTLRPTTRYLSYQSLFPYHFFSPSLCLDLIFFLGRRYFNKTSTMVKIECMG